MTKIDFSPSDAGAEPKFFSAQIDEAYRFHLKLPPEAGRLSVLYGGRERCRRDYRVDRKSFRFYSLEFIAAGNCEVSLNGVTHLLGPGSVFTYGPHVRHAIGSRSGDRLVKYFFTFAGKDASKLLQSCLLSPGTVVRTSAPAAVVSLMDDLIATALRRSVRQVQICTLTLEQIFNRICETSLPVAAVDSRAFATFERCRRHIEAHYLTLQNLAQIASACGINPSYLCRLFQSFSRQSPYQFLTQLKMEAAVKLLHRPGVLVKQVARELGFEDAFHFSRMFRRIHGISPRQLQRLEDFRR